ncbi:hypothetical protein FACS1894151_03350 [Spirochaetia bacterium]|nr:hypothetical protein FACS1894151_03350 [Spirochaetia bacterium]
MIKKTVIIPVFLICDNNYAPYMTVAITSICYHTQAFIEFYVVGKGISDENKIKIAKMQNSIKNFSIDYITLDIAAIYNIPYLLLSRMSPSTFARMIVSELKPDIDRSLCLDVDLIALDDIVELWDQPLDNFMFGAALDTPDSAGIMFKKNFNLNIEFNYINCGVLLLNCKAWRDNGIANKCFELEKIYRDKLDCFDQDIINRYFLGNFKLLNSRFNSIFGHEENIVIRHFCYLRKPWISKYNIEGNIINNFDDFWHYAKITSFYNEIQQNYETINKEFGYSARSAKLYYYKHGRKDEIKDIIGKLRRNVAEKQKIP